jgi:hypothetical protein
VVASADCARGADEDVLPRDRDLPFAGDFPSPRSLLLLFASVPLLRRSLLAMRSSLTLDLLLATESLRAGSDLVVKAGLSTPTSSAPFSCFTTRFGLVLDSPPDKISVSASDWLSPLTPSAATEPFRAGAAAADSALSTRGDGDLEGTVEEDDLIDGLRTGWWRDDCTRELGLSE